MKLHTFSIAPNPQRIELLIAEKQLDVPFAVVDLGKGEQLSDGFRARNPFCDLPMLELTDGTCISQVPAIATYLEEKFPEPALFGHNAEQRAAVYMWDNICVINGLHAVAEVLRNTSPRMKDRALAGPHNYAQIPQLADRGRLRIQHFFADIDQRLSSEDYLAGNFFSFADITAWVICNFAGWVKETIPDTCAALQEWRERVSGRPAFVARDQ